MDSQVTINEEVQGKLEVHYKEILSLLGEDAEREGLQRTPYRVAY